MRTFQPSCDHDAAAEQLGLPPRVTPTIDEFHPLIAGPALTVICVHDHANEESQAIEVPNSVIESCEDAEALAVVLQRVVGAELN